MNQDENHLNLLRIFHIVYGVLCFLFALFPVIYIVVGAAVFVGPDHFGDAPNGPPPQLMGGMFIALGTVMTVIIAGYGALQFLVSQGLANRKWWVLCLVVSGLNTMNMPVGTMLAVFSFVVLLRPSVKELFGQR